MSATEKDISTTRSGESAGQPPTDSSTEQSEDTKETVGRLPLDQTFELLKNKRRRAVLEYLRETEEDVVPIGELAEHIAAVENDIEVEAVSSSQRKRAYVGLYQCHLPKMDDMDVIEFRKNRGEISRANNADQLERFLDHEPGTARPWYVYYLALGLGGVGLFAIAQSGLTGLTTAASLGIFVVALLVCALFHAREEGQLQPDGLLP
jgi:hypothetical protein